MRTKKLATDGSFERVDWARYKETNVRSICVSARPFSVPRLTICLETGYGPLDLGRHEDRHLIRQTQRVLRPGFSASLGMLFESAVAETAAFLKALRVGPLQDEFASTATSYASKLLLELQAAEAAVSSLLPRGTPELRAIADAFLGKGSGGLKN